MNPSRVVGGTPVRSCAGDLVETSSEGVKCSRPWCRRVLGPWSPALPPWVPLEASFCCFWKRLTALQFFCVCCFASELPSFPNIQFHNPGIASNDSRAIASLGLTGDGQGATPGSTKARPSPKGL